MEKLPKISIPKHYNYIACFLTLQCNYNCDYCINYFSPSGQMPDKLIPGREWTAALNRLEAREDLPVTLQGGEPGLHPDFIWIINNIKPQLHIDILTNLSFDVDAFIKKVNPKRLSRRAPYANIRATYHPRHMKLDEVLTRVLKLQQAHFSIGLYGIAHPAIEREIKLAQDKCAKLGIDFRTKDFLGKYEGALYGTYRYPEAAGNNRARKCLCRTHELIIGPGAGNFRCHHYLYNKIGSVGNLLERNFKIDEEFKQCVHFGHCNPCDIKIKTNRFQIHGYTAVEIKEIEDNGE
ncbi:MAG: radical SAM protein [Candidatus Omnitrophota bacterium]